MLNIVIPMAGVGSRFVNAGYQKPKPFIDVAGKPMIVRVLENLSSVDANFILIARAEHLAAEKDLVRQIEGDYRVKFISIDSLTEGTACTLLFARKLISNQHPVLIANSDQIVDLNIKDFVDDAKHRGLDGSILTFIDNERNPKWSFVKINSEGNVIEVREKVAISNFATVGIYYFAEGQILVDSIIEMIIKNDRVNGEFYTCPVYNLLIKSNKTIGIFNIEKASMHGIGTPEDLNEYIFSCLSNKARSKL